MDQLFKIRFKIGVLGLFLFSSFAFAQANIPDYYGQDFIQQFETHSLDSSALKSRLFKIISNGHKAVGYENAKDIMFGRLFLKQTVGFYAVTDVYCEHTFTDEDFGTKMLGPMLSPNTGNVLNTEHTWPQSRFTGSFPKEMQKSDLHHLFPTDSKMNGVRGNLPFGNVLKPQPGLKCPIAKLGTSGKEVVFEVPMKQRGNSARAIFYFSVRYKTPISAEQEAALRAWNLQDPIDQEEIDQNIVIQEVQGNRNPFIDFPNLIQSIDNFSSTTY